MLQHLEQTMAVVVHIDRYLVGFVGEHGPLTYGLIFLVIFVETGFVVMPFLPGDSLLFAAGALAAAGMMDIRLLIAVLLVAAVIGVQVNYHIGRFIGPRVFSRSDGLFFRRDHLDRARTFCERYGAKAVLLSRFVPIVRSCAPFVVGVGRMDYAKFTALNAVGGLIWVFVFTLGGYYFGRLPWIKDNFSLVVLAIIVITTLPLVWEAWKARKR